MARDFDNVDDSVKIAVAPAGLLVNSFTYAAWANPDAGDGFITNLSEWAGAHNGWNVYVQGSGVVRLEIDTAGVTQINSTTNIVSAGGWHHVVVTYDGSNMRIYINGTQENSTGKTGSVDYGTAAFVVGNDAANQFDYDGQIAECIYWSKVFSATEVRNLYMGAHPFSFGTPLLYWPLFGTTTAEPDWSGNNNHGTVTGAVRTDHPTHISARHWAVGSPPFFTTGNVTLLIDTADAQTSALLGAIRTRASVAGHGGRGICG